MKLFRKKTPASEEERTRNKKLAKDVAMHSAFSASAQGSNHVGSERHGGANFDISTQQKIAVLNLLNQDRD